MKAIHLLVLAACALAACASNTGVVPLGRGSFMIAKQQATGFPGLGNLKAEVIAEGSAHCTALGATFELLSSKQTEPPYILGNYPRVEIEFTCRPLRPIKTPKSTTKDGDEA